MRLTTELARNALTYVNPLKEREVDLRGHRIPAIENLGVVGPMDSLDLTDNDIQVLGNLPLLPRLTTLLLGENRIASIQPSVGAALPSLRNLVLTGNRLQELADVAGLSAFARLTHLALDGNPIAKHEHYRYWVVWRCPSVRFLDYQKVKDAERSKAAQLFGTRQAPTDLALKILGTKSTQSTDDADAAEPSKLSRLHLTDAERLKLQEMVKRASSLDEIIRLEKILSEGRLPPGFQMEG